MPEQNYNAKVNENLEFTSIDPEALDFVVTGPNQFHILHDGQSYEAELISADHQEKLFQIKVNGSVYQVKLSDQYDQLINKLGLKVNSGGALGEIKAPMPGLVLEINVEEGQEVEEGTPLLILEAMKMENVIKAPGSGSIKKIHVKQGKPVDKNQVMIELK